jgi:NMD protein affecting ribosome stability and mRNA decay
MSKWCAECGKVYHMLGHILCRACFKAGGGWSK